MSITKFAKSQLKQSMLTGIPQIIQAKGPQKLLKSFVLMVCLSGCLYQIWSYMEVYWKYPVLVDVYVSNPNSITPPAFTICEYNGINRLKFCKEFPDLCTPKRDFLDFCQSHSQFCLKYMTNPKGKMPAVTPQELPQNISDVRSRYQKMGSQHQFFVDYVIYDDEYLSPKPVYVFNVQGLPTNCYAFNTVWRNSSAVLVKVPQRTGFEMLLKTDESQNFYLSTPNVIQMAVHSPFMMVNPFTEGFSVQSCSTYKMYLDKTEKTLLPAPYPTNCIDYEKTWRNRGGYGPLNQEMCIEECAFNRSIEIAGCFNPTFVDYPNDTAPFCYDGPSLEDVFEECTVKCQPACYEEEIRDKKKTTKCETGIGISFMKTQVMTFIYSQKYQGIEVFGYIGGILGMWLGLSLIAVCDFLETCLAIIIHACKKWKLSRRRNKNNVLKIKSNKEFMYYI
ncbi:hypothetical protein HNY73_012345 [Argiope bruennichi]|uniref:Uncharacterized protein n=1 Tax=Argiope bruennichi TaxID=94029 RepID=A0A8T0EV68_ARGBR|nr:hypothetical protein HNY73_012345 [Argiope bruennichi]